jgi:hypothetical protein
MKVNEAGSYRISSNKKAVISFHDNCLKQEKQSIKWFESGKNFK